MFYLPLVLAFQKLLSAPSDLLALLSTNKTSFYLSQKNILYFILLAPLTYSLFLYLHSDVHIVGNWHVAAFIS